MAITPAPPLLWPEMANSSTVLQLDILYITLTLLTLLHAINQRGLLSGTFLVTFIFFHTLFFEHTSLFLGGTHCHATSSYLPPITPCSSINSLLFYVPWLYTSIEGAKRISNLHIAAYPFAVGLLQLGFGAVYELQGPHQKFWHWPDENGIIAQSPVLEKWTGYPYFEFLEEARENMEVATISKDGVFYVSNHAKGALEERVYGAPLFAPYFHFAYGFGWALGLLIAGGGGGRGGGVTLGPNVVFSVKKTVIAGLLGAVLFLLPIWTTDFLSNLANLPLLVGVPLSLVLSFLPIFILPRKRMNGDYSNYTQKQASAPDALLFGISILMHAFFISFPFRAEESTPAGLHVLITCIAVVHIIAQYYCCFMSGGKGGEKLASKKF